MTGELLLLPSAALLPAAASGATNPQHAPAASFLLLPNCSYEVVQSLAEEYRAAESDDYLSWGASGGASGGAAARGISSAPAVSVGTGAPARAQGGAGGAGAAAAAYDERESSSAYSGYTGR